MEERDLPAASEVVRVAFDTFLGRSGPAGDKDAVRTRWTAQPDAALTAELDGELVGSNFATPWGSFGFFGPLTVRPELWDKGIEQAARVDGRAVRALGDPPRRALHLLPQPQTPLLVPEVRLLAEALDLGLRKAGGRVEDESGGPAGGEAEGCEDAGGATGHGSSRPDLGLAGGARVRRPLGERAHLGRLRRPRRGTGDPGRRRPGARGGSSPRRRGRSGGARRMPDRAGHRRWLRALLRQVRDGPRRRWGRGALPPAARRGRGLCGVRRRGADRARSERGTTGGLRGGLRPRLPRGDGRRRYGARRRRRLQPPRGLAHRRLAVAARVVGGLGPQDGRSRRRSAGSGPLANAVLQVDNGGVRCPQFS